MQSNRPLRMSLAAAVALASLGSTSSVLAQAGGVIEEVVVTARKKTESLQTVPVAVTALSGSFIEKNFASSVKDLDKYAPNVQLETQQFGGGALNASIRGMSYDEVEKTYEPAVGVSVDGVFFSHNSGAMVDMFDIESIEILRGPQGTLFGRNTMGGTVNIQRTKPSHEFGAKASVSYGSYDQRAIKARVTGSLVEDKLAGKLGVYQFSGDSHTENYFTGKQDDGMDRFSVVGSLLWTPTDTVSVQLSADYLDDDSEMAPVLNMTRPGELFCDLFDVCAAKSLDVAEDNDFEVSFGAKPFKSEIEARTYSLNASWDLADYTLTSITAYNELDELLDMENTGTPDIGGTSFFTVVRGQTLEQWSQEFRVTSEFSGPFNFVAGLFYFKSEYELDPQDVLLLGTSINLFKAEQQLDAYAVFGEMYYDLTDKASLTLGGRLTYEEKTLAVNSIIGGGFVCPDPNAPAGAESCRDPEVDFDDFSPRVGVDYQFTNDVMGYFTWSRGFRSGGWNGRPQTQAGIGPYEPEQLDNYELGVRSDWFDNRLRVNATVFHMKYDDKQEAIIRPSPVSLATETIVQNAASATVNGLELELQAMLGPNLQLRSAVGYLDAEFDEYLDDSGNDIKDQRHISYSPEWTISAGGDYYVQLDNLGGELVFTANYKWTDEYATDPIVDPLGLEREIIDEYGEFDFSVSYDNYTNAGNRYRVSAFVQDAFNDEGRIFRVTNAGAWVFGDQEPGRTWGIEFTYDM